MKIEQIKQQYMSNEIKFHDAIEALQDSMPLHEAIGTVRRWSKVRIENSPQVMWVRVELDQIDRKHSNADFIRINFDSGSRDFPKSVCSLVEVEEEATLIVPFEYAVETGIQNWAEQSGACRR